MKYHYTTAQNSGFDSDMTPPELAEAYFQLKRLALQSLVGVEPAQFTWAQKELIDFLKIHADD
jgi:hypothetical protein